MEKKKFCVNPKCEREPLREIESESTWTMKKCFCIKCGRGYGVVTKVGKFTQISTLVTASVMITNFALGLLGDVNFFDGDDTEWVSNDESF